MALMTQILTKTRKTLFDVWSSCRALVLSGMLLPLRASSYAKPYHLSHNCVITNIKKKNPGFSSLKNIFFISLLQNLEDIEKILIYLLKLALGDKLL